MYNTTTDYSTTGTQQVYIQPIKVPVATLTPEQIQANAKSAVAYSTATTDLQTLDNKSIQTKYGMTKPELAQAVKQLDQQVSGQKIGQTAQSEMAWDPFAAATSATRARLVLDPNGDLPFVDPKEDPAGFKQRETEMSTRANIALNVYSQLKKNAQEPIKDVNITVTRSSNDPERYNVSVVTTDSSGNRTTRPTVRNVDPAALDKLPEKMGIEYAEQNTASDDAQAAREGALALREKALEISDKFRASASTIAALRQAARARGYNNVEISEKSDVPNSYLMKFTPAEGSKAPAFTAELEGTTPSNAEMQTEASVEMAKAASEECEKAGDPAKEIKVTVKRNGDISLEVETESGKKITFEGNMNDVNGAGEQGTEKALSSTRSFGSEYSSNKGSLDESASVTNNMLNSGSKDYLIIIAQLVSNARQEIIDSIEAHDAKKKENEEIYRKKLAKEKEQTKNEKEQQAKLAEEYKMLASNIEKTLDSQLVLDAGDRVALAWKAMYLADKARKG